MFPEFSEGPVILSAWVYREGQYQECEIVEADAQTQTAEIQPRGSLYNERVPFCKIQSVTLKHSASNRVIEHFGRPRVHVPESIAYIPQFAGV